MSLDFTIGSGGVLGFIQPFDGKGGRLVAEEWIQNYELIMRTSKLRSKQFAPLMGNCLHGTAKNWWTSLSRETKEDWESLTEHFYAAFARDTVDPVTSYTLASKRTQGEEETVLDYALDLRRLWTSASYEPDTQNVRDSFICGLLPEIRVKLLDTDTTEFTFDELVAEAEKHERAIIHKRLSMNKRSINVVNRELQTPVLNEKRIDELVAKSISTHLEQFAERTKQVNEISTQHHDARSGSDAADFVTKSGMPICRLCYRVGHVQYQCSKRQKVNNQTTPESYSPIIATNGTANFQPIYTHSDNNRTTQLSGSNPQCISFAIPEGYVLSRDPNLSNETKRYYDRKPFGKPPFRQPNRQSQFNSTGNQYRKPNHLQQRRDQPTSGYSKNRPKPSVI